MKTARELTPEELVSIVGQIQGMLYLDLESGGREFWNPKKDWSADTLDYIARTLADHGLVPTEPAGHDDPVRGELERLQAQIEEGDDQSVLDELVHDLKGAEGSAINNGGVQEQVEYVVSQLGPE